jgi:predicted ABC-type ATPase
MYLWLPDYRIAMQRIKKRVAGGGHNVSNIIVKRRFLRGLDNLINLYLPLSDYWIVIDNSQTTTEPIADGNNESNINVYNDEKWKIIKDTLNTYNKNDKKRK